MHRLRQLIGCQHERTSLDKEDHSVDDDAGVVGAARKHGRRVEDVQREVVDCNDACGRQDRGPAAPACYHREGGEEEHVDVDLQVRARGAEHYQADEGHGCRRRQLARDSSRSIDACDQSDDGDKSASKSGYGNEVGVRDPRRENGNGVEQTEAAEHHRHEGAAQGREVAERCHSWRVPVMDGVAEAWGKQPLTAVAATTRVAPSR